MKNILFIFQFSTVFDYLLKLDESQNLLYYHSNIHHVHYGFNYLVILNDISIKWGHEETKLPLSMLDIVFCH